MTVSLAWPSVLPKPLLETHGFKPMPPTARTEIDRGAIVQKRRFKQVPTEVPFSLVLNEQQMLIFEAWVEHRAKHGARWFSIDLWSGEGLVSHEARFKEIERYKELKFDRWLAAGTFEVRERPIYSAELLELILEWGGDPAELIAALETLTLQAQTIQLIGNHR